MMPFTTPYQYAFNNPVMMGDPSGMAPEKNEKSRDRQLQDDGLPLTGLPYHKDTPSSNTQTIKDPTAVSEADVEGARTGNTMDPGMVDDWNNSVNGVGAGNTYVFQMSSPITGAPSINGLGSGGANVGGNSAVVATGDRYEDVTVSRSLTWRAFDPHKDLRYMPNLASRNEMIDQCSQVEQFIAETNLIFEINGMVIPNGNKQAVLWNFVNHPDNAVKPEDILLYMSRNYLCNSPQTPIGANNNFSQFYIDLVKKALGISSLDLENSSNSEFHYHCSLFCPDYGISLNFPYPSNQDWIHANSINIMYGQAINYVIAFDHNVYIYGYERKGKLISIIMTWDQFRTFGK